MTDFNVSVTEQEINVTVEDENIIVSVQEAGPINVDLAVPAVYAQDLQVGTGEAIIKTATPTYTEFKSLTQGDDIVFTVSSDDIEIALDQNPIIDSLTLQGMVGPIVWNDDDGTLDVPLNDDVVLQVGQEINFKAKNLTGVNITNGTVVRITGATGGLLNVALADSSAEVTSSTTIGVATQDINNNAVGYVTTQGLVRGLNTAAYTEGDPVWLGSNGGYMVGGHPETPDHLVHLGWVVRSHAAEGSIWVQVNNGWELDELHDVLITNAQNGDYLRWDSANGYWSNTTIDSSDIAATLSNFSGNIIPSQNNVYTLGNVSNMWKDVYIGPGSLYIDGQKVIGSDPTGNIDFTTDTGQNMVFGAGGDIYQQTDTLFQVSAPNTQLGTAPTAVTTVAGELVTPKMSTGTNTEITDGRIEVTGTNMYIETSGPGSYFTWLNTDTTYIGNDTLNLLSVSGDTVGSSGNININPTGSLTLKDHDTSAEVDAKIAALVASAPASLDTLNELAAALNDDPNFATTITTLIGTKVNTSDFGTLFDTNFATKNTDDLGEGLTNLYHTTSRARNAISATGSISYSPTTGVISYTQPTNVSAFVNDAGYLTSYTETDPTVPVHVKNITPLELSNWNTAYGWGDHGTQGYLTNITGESIANLSDVSYPYGVADNHVLSYQTAAGGWIAVPITTDNLPEGSTNLYFTDARAIAAVEGVANINLGDITHNGSSWELSSDNNITISDGAWTWMNTDKLSVGASSGFNFENNVINLWNTTEATLNGTLNVSDLIKVNDGWTLSTFNPYAAYGGTAMDTTIMGVGQEDGWAGVSVRSRHEHDWGLSGMGINPDKSRAFYFLQASDNDVSNNDINLSNDHTFGSIAYVPYSDYRTGMEWLTPSAEIQAISTQDHSVTNGFGTKLRLSTTPDGDFAGATDASHNKVHIDVQGNKLTPSTGTLDVSGAITTDGLTSDGALTVNNADLTISNGNLDVNNGLGLFGTANESNHLLQVKGDAYNQMAKFTRSGQTANDTATAIIAKASFTNANAAGKGVIHWLEQDTSEGYSGLGGMGVKVQDFTDHNTFNTAFKIQLADKVAGSTTYPEKHTFGVQDSSIGSNLTVTGNLQVDGTTSIKGNTTIGDDPLTDSHTVNGPLTVNGFVVYAQYDTATANYYAGLGVVPTGACGYITDGDAGSPCLGVYDGSNWKRISFGANISTT